VFSSFLKETVAGLDIGEDYIGGARLSLKEGADIHIAKIGHIEKKPGSSNHDQAKAIKRLWRKYRIDTHTVVSCLRSPSVAMKHFKYSSLSTSDLSSAISLEAEQVFQRPKDELYIDWHIYPDKNPNVSEGVLVAAPKEDVENHLAILRMAGLYPIALDVGPMAIGNLFLKLRPINKDEVACVVSVDKHTLDMCILSREARIYPRSVYSKATPLSERIEYIVENIDEFLRYYEFKLRKPPPTRLVVTGGLATDKSLSGLIEKSLKIPVEFWDPLKDGKSYAYSAALGLALRGCQ